MPPAFAQPYSARRTTSDGVGIVELLDHRNNTTVSIVPSIGNIAYRMEVNSKNVFWFPYRSVAEFAAQPRLCGNPLLAPWANRLDEDGFFANGRKFLLDPAVKNFIRDGNNLPLHGLLLFASQWEVQSVLADSEQAAAVSRLDFSRYPELLAQFPFAHTIEMTYA
jgi:aldose 1-epimerase